MTATEDRIRATYAVDLLDAVMESYGFPRPPDPTECSHPSDEQWVLRPGRIACGECGRVVDSE